MSQPSHQELQQNITPGPWEFVNGRIMSTVTKDEINHLVDDATYEANERLKAKAPELLAENKRLKAELALRNGVEEGKLEAIRRVKREEVEKIVRDEARRIIDEIVSLKLLLNEILTDLPSRRDWLDPNLERRMREAVKTTQLEIEIYGTAHGKHPITNQGQTDTIP